MWTKIKTWLAIAGTAILGLFITLFGFTRRKLKKTEEKLEEKTQEVKAHEKANEIEKDVEKQIAEIKKETTEKLLDTSTYDYNMEIKKFNERK